MLSSLVKRRRDEIDISGFGECNYHEIYYDSEENRDKAVNMLQTAIRAGAQYFKFPTDDEIEGIAY